MQEHGDTHRPREGPVDWGKPRELAGVKRTTDQKVGGSNPSGRATVVACDVWLFSSAVAFS